MAITKKTSPASFFQMPLHYPRFTHKDYQNMPEWQLDMLLAQYGLPVYGDLSCKREFAMGAFLWTDSSTHQEPRDCSSSSSYDLNHDPSHFYHKFKILELLYRVFLGNNA